MGGEIFDRYRDLIPDFDRFRDSLDRPLPTHLRMNRLKGDPDQVALGVQTRGIRLRRSHPADDALYAAPGLDAPGNLVEYRLGLLHPQALTSCLAAVALAPETGALVLDMCAAPGGKTAHMADLMQNTGLIVANELYADRQRSLGHTLDRMGVLNCIITGYQAQEFPRRQAFDRILADVPCSGQGTFRTGPEATPGRKPKGPGRLPDLQKKIILRGYDLLRPGGRMLYSTCTYDPEENEGVVHHLLEKRAAEVLPIRLDCAFDPGTSRWEGKDYDRGVERTARFYPHRTDSVGFFMARIGRPS